MNDETQPPVPPAYPTNPPQSSNYSPFQGGRYGYQTGFPPNQTGYVPGAYQQPYHFQTNTQTYPGSPRTSGYRIAAGIVGIVLGAWLFLSFIVGISLQQGAVLVMVFAASLGSMAAGIVLLVQHRSRGRAAPIVMICTAGLALLFSFASFGQLLFTFLLSTPIFIVMGIGLAGSPKDSKDPNVEGREPARILLDPIHRPTCSSSSRLQRSSRRLAGCVRKDALQGKSR